MNTQKKRRVKKRRAKKRKVKRRRRMSLHQYVPLLDGERHKHNGQDLLPRPQPNCKGGSLLQSNNKDSCEYKHDKTSRDSDNGCLHHPLRPQMLALPPLPHSRLDQS
jgi:hypothetical protein